MEQADHALTLSYGSSDAAKAYRAEIQELIRKGRWHEAMEKEVADVRRVAGAKYDEAIAEMLEYAKSIGILK